MGPLKVKIKPKKMVERTEKMVVKVRGARYMQKNMTTDGMKGGKRVACLSRP